QYLSLWTEARRAIAQRYNSMIDEHQLGHFLTKPCVKPFGKHTFNQYTVRVKNGQRDALREWLRPDQIGTEISYPGPLHLQKVYADMGHEKGDFPATEQACREVMSLPIFPELTIEQQRRVMSSCASFLRQQVRMAA